MLSIAWLQERPYAAGGAWGLGCEVCAHLRRRLQRADPDTAERSPSIGGLRVGTRWARHEVFDVGRMCAWAFMQHSQSRVHKVAMHIFLRPELSLHRVLRDEELSAALSLQQGAVPPPEHWLRVWRFVRTPTSFRGAQAVLGTESFLAHLRTGQDRQRTHHKAIAKTVACMSAVLRARTRAALEAARSITVAVDDRGPYRLISYRCDVPGAAPPAATSPAAADGLASAAAVPPATPWPYRDGLLGVHCTSAGEDESLRDLDDDYSLRMRDSVVSTVEALFCGGSAVPDRVAAQAVLSKVHTFLGDGAASVQKCGALLRASACRNIAVILRDPVHAMRTSTSEPLKRHGDFQAFWEDVFDKRHALVPDIQHSDAWRRRLVLAQNHVLTVSGQQGGGLQCALRHLSFAKQRFDSATGPARKFCCLLAAIVILLVTVAADKRLKSAQRERASRLIDDMTPARIVTAGLFADYMAECTSFFRHFEKTHHDVALSLSQKDTFLKRMKTPFIDGFVLADLGPEVAAADAGVADETCIAIIIEQAMAFGTLVYDDRRITLWPASARAATAAAGAQMRDIVEAALDRVEAEMPAEDLVCAFSVFNLAT